MVEIPCQTWSQVFSGSGMRSDASWLTVKKIMEATSKPARKYGFVEKGYSSRCLKTKAAEGSKLNKLTVAVRSDCILFCIDQTRGSLLGLNFELNK